MTWTCMPGCTKCWNNGNENCAAIGDDAQSSACSRMPANAAANRAVNCVRLSPFGMNGGLPYPSARRAMVSTSHSHREPRHPGDKAGFLTDRQDCSQSLRFLILPSNAPMQMSTEHNNSCFAGFSPASPCTRKRSFGQPDCVLSVESHDIT